MTKLNRTKMLALASGVLSLLLAWGYLKGKEAYLNSFKEPVSVLVATKDIDTGVLLDEAFLKVTEVPKRFLQPGALIAMESASGQITAVPILKDEQIVGTKLTALGAQSGLGVRIPPGKRALSIEVNESSGVADLIRPNNFVDVVATFEMEGSDENSSSATSTVAQGILVLAVGQDLGGPSAAQKKNSVASSADLLLREKKNTVTLALSPKQVQEIEFAKVQGKISLALRPQWEEDTTELTPTTSLEVIGFRGHARRTGFREYRGR